ncbi:Myosin 3, partial [Caligus rogercresseyi]
PHENWDTYMSRHFTRASKSKGLISKNQDITPRFLTPQSIISDSASTEMIQRVQKEVSDRSNSRRGSCASNPSSSRKSSGTTFEPIMKAQSPLHAAAPINRAPYIQQLQTLKKKQEDELSFRLQKSATTNELCPDRSLRRRKQDSHTALDEITFDDDCIEL